LPAQSKPWNIVPEAIVYEHPLNERVRTFLRLEHLFGKIDYFLSQQEEWATRAVIESLLDILSITARADIKTEILKELDRQGSLLERIGRQPGVDTRTLGQLLHRLEQVGEQVYRLGGQIGQQMRESEFIKGIMQRSSIPGGTLSFDLPQFHHWLRGPHEARRRSIQEWMQGLEPIRDGVALLLSLARDSNEPKRAHALQGFFQGTLDSQAAVQMIRVALDPKLAMFPEVSGHRHRFSIRFMEAENTGRPTQTTRDLDFLLTTCVF